MNHYVITLSDLQLRLVLDIQAMCCNLLNKFFFLSKSLNKLFYSGALIKSGKRHYPWQITRSCTINSNTNKTTLWTLKYM